MALSYYRHVRTRAKGRWYGRKLADISVEFGPYARLISDPEHIITPEDSVEYSVHVHEPPVPSLGLPESILVDSKDYLVLNKPSGIPVHPTVNYYQHSVTEMLRSRFGITYPCYRLDRLTSGILILGKTAEFASQFHRLDRRKFYFARVRSADIPNPLRLHGKMALTNPIVTFNGKLGFEKFLESYANSKPAETQIEIVNDDGQLVTLYIEPVTGRTHQIRKHLALHGMPIHNDRLYNDNGRFKRLCEDPSRENFEAVWQFTEESRLAKLTGENCEECGAPLYDGSIGAIDLHCGIYEFSGTRIQAPASFPTPTNSVSPV